MTFYVNLDNIKVVDNLSIFIVQKIHDFNLSGLGAMKFWSLLSGFCGVLYSSEILYNSTMLAWKLAHVDN